MRKFLIGSALLGLASPGLAQTIVSTQAPISSATTAVEAGRLALGQKIAGRLLPDGIYQKMLGGTMDQLMSGMMDQMMDLPMRDLAGMAGMKPEELKALGPGTMKQVMAIMDPNFKARMNLTMKVMMGEMGGLMGAMEPDLRAGLAEAYASQYSTEQLSEIDRFFATPTGATFAGKSTLIMMDPAMMKRMQAMMPKIMDAMPAMIQKVTAANATLPKVRDYKALTADERAKLASLLGMKASDLK
jgi:Uncharacterized protein conserved in bacteria (DUF2059)